MLSTRNTLIGGLVVVLLGGGTIYAITQKFSQPPRAKTAPTATVVIKVKAPEPLYTNQQKQIDQLARQLVQQPPNQAFDASGFTQFVYEQVGAALPRTIVEQSQIGTKIPLKKDLEEGDLVFFNLDQSALGVSFVGIYLSQGSFAAYTTHGLQIIDLNSAYWSDKFQFGVRVL